MTDLDTSLLPTLRALAGLVIAAMIVMGSPGPATISATAAGAAFGWRRSMPFLAGLIAGTTAVLLAVAAGAVTLILSVPYAPHMLTVGSAAYIVYLAWQIATAPPLAVAGGATPTPYFSGGFLLGIANPKAYLAIAAVFTGTTVLPCSAGADTAIKVAVLAAMIITIHLAWLFAGAGLTRILRDARLSRIVNVAFAIVLVATTALALLR
jgi:threonine/homoserine/homoserine lactone efflux protein